MAVLVNAELKLVAGMATGKDAWIQGADVTGLVAKLTQLVLHETPKRSAMTTVRARIMQPCSQVLPSETCKVATCMCLHVMSACHTHNHTVTIMHTP